MSVQLKTFAYQFSETSTAQESKLASLHYKECIEKRGLNPSWIEVNCRSITKEEASLLLGYPARSGGIWLSGIGIQGQFKPDKPWLSDTDKTKTDKKKRKAPKYRSPKITTATMTRCCPTIQKTQTTGVT